MKEVDLWFRKYEMSHPKVKRKIYLATDEPLVIKECQKKYPHYTIYNSLENAKSATKENGERYTEASLLGMIHDVHMLSLARFVVCTHTSNTCRLLYELMHYKHGDASSMVYSLDSPWSNPFLRKHIRWEAVLEDKKTGLRRGDTLISYDKIGSHHVQVENKWMVKTENQRTTKEHQYPQFYLRQVPTFGNFSLFD